MRSVAFFGNIVHAARTNLHFYPLAGVRHYGGMQALVTVGFGGAYPIAQAVGVGLVKVRHNAVYLPASGFFLLRRHIQNNTNSKQVVYLFKGDVLLPHLLEHRIDTLGAAFYFVAKTLRFHLVIDRLHKLLDKAVASALALLNLAFISA